MPQSLIPLSTLDATFGEKIALKVMFKKVPECWQLSLKESHQTVTRGRACPVDAVSSQSHSATNQHMLFSSFFGMPDLNYL